MKGTNSLTNAVLWQVLRSYAANEAESFTQAFSVTLVKSVVDRRKIEHSEWDDGHGTP